MTATPGSPAQHPSIRRQLWQAKRKERRRAMLGLLCIGALLGGVVYMAFLGWFNPRQPAAPAASWTADAPAPIPRRAEVEKAARLLEVEKAVAPAEWQTGNATGELAAILSAFAGEVAAAEYGKLVVDGRPVLDEAVWRSSRGLEATRARMAEILGTLHPDWPMEWAPFAGGIVFRHENFQCRLLPIDDTATLIVLKRLF